MKRHDRSILLAALAGAALLLPATRGDNGRRAGLDTVAKVTADSILETLSVREKIGQLIMPWLLGNYSAIESDAYDRAARWLDSNAVGGIIISLGTPLSAAAKLNALQTRSKLPLLIAADLEYGLAMRMAGATAFPYPMAFGATGKELDAYQLGRVTALEARAVGIHWTFSPVADLNSNPANPIINTRAFGESPEAVAPLMAAYVQGARDHGLYTTAKHFPGHGDTSTDSHLGLPELDACWDRLDTLELRPFAAAIDAGVTSVMTAHIVMRCLDGDNGPATFSEAIMNGVLRDSLGFDGLVVTDALVMGAIVNQYGAGETAVRAFLAGSDMLLMPADIDSAVTAMVHALETGRFSEERLDRSVRRVLELKVKAGLFERRTVSLDSVSHIVGTRANQDVANDIAARALTLVQRGDIAAYRARRTSTALITYAEETNLTIGETLRGELMAHGETVRAFRLFPASGAMSYDSAHAIITNSPRVVFASSVRPIAGRGHVALPQRLAQLVLETDSIKPTILVSFGSPYLLEQVLGFRGAYLLAWHDVLATELAVGRALAGGTAIEGTLPITLSERFPRGHGVRVGTR